jgi:hypothetical protein
MNMNFNTVLNNLKLYDIDYIVIGSHALYLLDNKFNLGIDIDLTNKDLDLVIKDNNNFYEFIKDFEINVFNQKSKNFQMHKIINNEGKNIDLISKLNFRHMKIENNFIPYIDYNNIKEYCYDGEIYDNAINYINLEVYYGIVKSTGLKKYKPIIEQILQKYPDIKNRVIA